DVLLREPRREQPPPHRFRRGRVVPFAVRRVDRDQLRQQFAREPLPALGRPILVLRNHGRGEQQDGERDEGDGTAWHQRTPPTLWFSTRSVSWRAAARPVHRSGHGARKRPRESRPGYHATDGRRGPYSTPRRYHTERGGSVRACEWRASGRRCADG